MVTAIRSLRLARAAVALGEGARVVIAAIDHALERMVRRALPLPEEIGDVSFDPPDRTWGAQLSRVTVNLFLFDVARSPQPPRPAEERVRSDGRVERRAPLPMVRLSYLVTAWAGSTRDEHELLSEVLTALVTHQVIPADDFDVPYPGTAQLALSDRDGRRPGDVWGSLDGRLRPGLELEVTVPLTSEPWRVAPPAVELIAGLVAPQPKRVEESPPLRRSQVRRGPGGSMVRSATVEDR
jgi:hypothetical protein